MQYWKKKKNTTNTYFQFEFPRTISNDNHLFYLEKILSRFDKRKKNTPHVFVGFELNFMDKNIIKRMIADESYFCSKTYLPPRDTRTTIIGAIE